MGLFDEVTCEVPLPDGKPSGVFQTKDFEFPYLEQYTIRADGRLIHHRPLYDCDPPGTQHGPIDTNFHGLLRFASYNTETKEHRIFVAKFTDGQLVKIEQIIERREARIVHGTTALPEIVRIDIDDE